MGRIAKHLLNDRRGATAIEYSLVAALIGLVIIANLGLIGTAINSTMLTISTYLG